MSSSKSLPSLTLAIRFTEKGGELLTDFANTHPEDWDRFDRRWWEATTRGWRGDEDSFRETQKLVREIWEGKHKGYDEQLVAQGLSLYQSRQEEGYFDTSMELFHVHWGYGFIWASPRDLGDYVWLSLLQHSQKLAVCANKDNRCPAPYFIRKKKTQKFCSEECAAPSQREFKRLWFREHGEEWRRKRLKKRSRSKKSSKRRA